ncbi:SIS domain-containing protein [Microlunatus antarcticus]|uniref:Tagatose-6-phosphate ketose/aldose isomerase n=1 Tax=Microlunatus antarcticus TaxID=53388 RepID=A0A7W5JTF8_9ACTN|nr:tagatose-6-phosphate ketose/aldose isomerase [Microlunatus antarcticus]
MSTHEGALANPANPAAPAGPGGEGWGTSATAREIAQQPRVWRELAVTLGERAGEIEAFLEPLLARPHLRIVLTGAGTSAFAGELLAPALAQAMRRRVDPVASTTIVGGPGAVFVEDVPTLLVSFARSGNSPESVAAAALADQLLTSVHHLVVCCHGDSDLAHAYAADDRALVLLMPPATHDVGFAMTSSFTTMVLGCWFALTGTGTAAEVVDRLARGADELLSAAGEVAALAERGFSRVAYLGSGPLAGLAQEAALKLLELTAGGVLGQHDSPLGFRHGPKAMLTDDTMVVVLRSTDAYTARYDDDIVAELVRDLDPGQVAVLGGGPLPAAVQQGAGWTWRVDGLDGLGDVPAAVVYAVFVQLFALRSSIVRGLTPDNPFPSGEVNRVVRGVSVHPYTA